MATQTTLTTAKGWHPDQVAFVPEEVIPGALVLAASTQVGFIEGDEPAIRVPWIADDGPAGFVAEGTPIPESAAQFTETVVRTGKIATLGKFSREQLGQKNAARLIVNSMQRSVIAKADAAFLSNPDEPTGLLNLPGATDGGLLGNNLDALADAITTIEADGGSATHIIAAPGAWGTVAKLKSGTGSAAPLLGAGVEQTQRRALGVDVLVSSAMPADTLLVLDRHTILSAVGVVTQAQSDDVYFDSDVVGVRVTFRVGWAAMKPERIVKISTTTG